MYTSVESFVIITVIESQPLLILLSFHNTGSDQRVEVKNLGGCNCRDAVGEKTGDRRNLRERKPDGWRSVPDDCTVSEIEIQR